MVSAPPLTVFFTVLPVSPPAVEPPSCPLRLEEENGLAEGRPDFLSFSPEMVAEQFTLMDAVSIGLFGALPFLASPLFCWWAQGAHCCQHLESLLASVPPFQELFKKVMPYHCLGCIWSQRDKKGKEHLAPTIRATVSQFNSVTNCVIATCLGDRTLKPQQRAKVVERWIEVARVSLAPVTFSLSGAENLSLWSLEGFC